MSNVSIRYIVSDVSAAVVEELTGKGREIPERHRRGQWRQANPRRGPSGNSIELFVPKRQGHGR